MTQPNAPQLSRASLPPTRTVEILDEYGQSRQIELAGERPLTIYLNKQEVVTLMTLGNHPEALVIGYLRNQGFLGDRDRLLAVQVDWDTEAAAVVTESGDTAWRQRLAKRTVTSGCGQGTLFGELMDQVTATRIVPMPVRQSQVYRLLANLAEANRVYRAAGAVHSCALCEGEHPLYFVEDVGRHNAVDAIAGQMWLDGVGGEGKAFYTTGRLTSEMIIKAAQMSVAVVISRSGMTEMGLELARRLGITVIGRAKGRHLSVFSGAEHLLFDAMPAAGPSAPLEVAHG